MRSFTRALVVGAIALPLALAGAGLATAHPTDMTRPDHHARHASWLWGWYWQAEEGNAGIVNENNGNDVGR